MTHLLPQTMNSMINGGNFHSHLRSPSLPSIFSHPSQILASDLANPPVSLTLHISIPTAVRSGRCRCYLPPPPQIRSLRSPAARNRGCSPGGPPQISRPPLRRRLPFPITAQTPIATPTPQATHHRPGENLMQLITFSST